MQARKPERKPSEAPYRAMTVRLPGSLHQQLREVAVADRRSINTIVEMAVERYVEQYIEQRDPLAAKNGAARYKPPTP